MASHVLLFLALLVNLLFTAHCIGYNDFSSKVRRIYIQVMDELARYPNLSPIDKELVPTTAKVLFTPDKTQKPKLVDVLAYGNDYKDDKSPFADFIYPELIKAKEEVLITTFSFDKELLSPPKPGKKQLVSMPVAIKNAIETLEREGPKRKSKVRFYLIYDYIGTAFFQGEFPEFYNAIITPSHMEDPADIGLTFNAPLQWVDLQVKKIHRGLFGTMHSKMMVIDGKRLLMGSKNLDADKSLEYMFAMEGIVAYSMRMDFKAMWPSLPSLLFSDHSDTQGHVPVLVVSRRMSTSSAHVDVHAPQDQAWLKALEVATDHVYIQSPNFCEERVAAAVVAAVKNKVKVTIVTSFRQQDANQSVMRGTVGSNSITMNKMYGELGPGSGLTWCWYIGSRVGAHPTPKQTEWSHVKFMAVDDTFVIIGSGNQDAQSWYGSRENNVLIDSEEATKQMVARLKAIQLFGSNCYTGAVGEQRAT